MSFVSFSVFSFLSLSPDSSFLVSPLMPCSHSIDFYSFGALVLPKWLIIRVILLLNWVGYKFLADLRLSVDEALL